MEHIPTLNKTSAVIRKWILHTPFFSEFEIEIAKIYAQLNKNLLAVRSSVTAEDLIAASFAGVEEFFTNVRSLKKILQTIKLVHASLFTSRVIAYRHHQGFVFNQW